MAEHIFHMVDSNQNAVTSSASDQDGCNFRVGCSLIPRDWCEEEFNVLDEDGNSLLLAFCCVEGDFDVCSPLSPFISFLCRDATLQISFVKHVNS